MNFARNPEEVRAESERRWNSKMAARGGGRTGPPPNRDVVGRAKGQGQDANVLRNRLKKTENKGKHIRNMADKKMSKGMF
jgi:activating signal cointegrator complex subunit 2